MTLPSPVVERLREALRLRGRSPNWLQQQLAERGVAGGSSGSVSRYMSGKSQPPLVFLQAAARALKVFEPWLLSGHGHPDQSDSPADPEVERLRRLTEGFGDLVREWSEDDRIVEHRIADRFFGFRALRDSTRMVVVELFQRCAQYEVEYRRCVVPWDEQQTRHGYDLQLAAQLGKVLSAPLDLLGLDRSHSTQDLTPDQLNQYVLACCTAISILLPERKEPSDDDWTEGQERSAIRLDAVRRHRAEGKQRSARPRPVRTSPPEDAAG